MRVIFGYKIMHKTYTSTVSLHNQLSFLTYVKASIILITYGFLNKNILGGSQWGGGFWGG